MKHTPENPFASPETLQSRKPPSSVYRDLIPLWIWLGVSVVGSIAITPADPISMLMILLPSVISLWVGLALVTTTSRVIQVALFILIIAPIAWLAMPIVMFYPWGGPCYVGLNVSLGTYAAWCLGNRRLKVISYFTIGFLLGSIMMCFGTITGAVLATLLAVRTSETPSDIIDNVEV